MKNLTELEQHLKGGWAGNVSQWWMATNKTEPWNTPCDLPPDSLACVKNEFSASFVREPMKPHFSHATKSHAKPNHATVQRKERGKEEYLCPRNANFSDDKKGAM